MSILRVHIDETLETIKQTFDDREVSRAQVAYWYIAVGNEMLGQHIGKRDSGQYLSTFDAIPVVRVSSSVNPNFVKGRKFLQLPFDVFDFDKDNGIEYIAYVSPGGNMCPPKFEFVKFHRTTPSEAEYLAMHPHTKPSSKNPYWYRTGKNIYLLGVENVPISAVEMGIYMTINPIEKIDIDQPFNFPDELIHVLKRKVLDLARMDFFFPTERRNEGADENAEENKGTQIPKIVSVNPQPDQQQQ